MDMILVPVPVLALRGSPSIDPINMGVPRDAPLPDNSALPKCGDYVYRGTHPLPPTQHLHHLPSLRVSVEVGRDAT
jgi:hypothetical protein